MTSTIGRGGSASATTAEATVYDPLVDGSGCVVYVLRNNEPTDGTGNTLLVRYAKLQGASNWVPVPPGGVHYIVDKKGVDAIYAKSAASTAAYSGGPVGCMG
jgi:hypothetical protein